MAGWRGRGAEPDEFQENALIDKVEPYKPLGTVPSWCFHVLNPDTARGITPQNYDSIEASADSGLDLILMLI